MPQYDVVIKGGLVFDGRGDAPLRADVGIKDGVVVEVAPGLSSEAADVVDAAERWVMPGFIDLHTHYDAEIEVASGLSESVRHGVTTVVVGSCSLSMALGSPDDLADMFCRVEAIPDRLVRPLLRQLKTWNDQPGYLDHLDTLPLGPNVAAFSGHSALRAHVMGLSRSVTPGESPSSSELAQIEALVEQAVDVGYLGVSIQTLPWDKMGGSADYRSRPLPSTFGSWSEYRRITKILRRRGAILQGVPNVSTKVNVLLFLLESVGLFRKTLKTTVISMMEPRSSPGIHRLIGAVSRFFHRFLKADFRWQALPNVFDLWADGIDLVVFEEFGAGTAALHVQDAVARGQLLRDPMYRKRFRKEWTSRLLPKAFHRDFNQSKILACPDPSVVGRSFADVGAARGVDGVDAFLDLVSEHGDAVRWYTVMCNEQVSSVQEIVSHPDVLLGFSDAGAHLRQMSHYNFPLRLLKLVRDAEQRGQPFMSVERAVHRLTGEIGAWLGLDAGTLQVGKRADVVVVDPRFLDARLDEVSEVPIQNFGDDAFRRLVRRNDDAVPAVFIGGIRAVESGCPVAALGRVPMGRLLRASTTTTTTKPAPALGTSLPHAA